MPLLPRIRVVSLAINLPGPMAAHRLTQFGATVTKIEPPQGDPVAHTHPELYRKLHRDQNVVVLDLKTDGGKAQLDKLFSEADLLLTSMRPRALTGLSLGWDELHRQFPRLCHVAIIGFPPPEENRSGHDLLYQAIAGLIEPPQLPRTLIADYAGSERAVSMSLALLLARANTGEAGFETVSLAEAAVPFADPIRYGATRVGGLLRGALPGYALYRARSGWIAVAALESSFLLTLQKALGLQTVNHETLTSIFLTRTAAEWEDFGKQHDLPIAAVLNLEV